MVWLSSYMVRRTVPNPVRPVARARPNLCHFLLFLFVRVGWFRGVDDLRDGIIRTPLPPMTTFQDDPLRVLRAVRFAARFGFTLHEVRFSSRCFRSCLSISARAVQREPHFLSPIANPCMCQLKCCGFRGRQEKPSCRLLTCPFFEIRPRRE